MITEQKESEEVLTDNEKSEEIKPKLNKDFLKRIDGKDFVLFSGLLSLAHQKGLSELSVEILQFPSPENGDTTICRAKAVTKAGEIFSDIGDANPKNTNKFIAVHAIRMASTRSIARTLRSLTNIGITCLEELGDLSEVIDDGKGKKETTDTLMLKEKRNGNGNGSAKNISQESNKKNIESVPPVIKKSGNNNGGNAPKTYYQACLKKYNSPLPKDSANGNGKNEGNRDTAVMSEAQKRAMDNLSKRRKISESELEALCKSQFGVTVENLSSVNASQFIRLLQQSA